VLMTAILKPAAGCAAPCANAETAKTAAKIKLAAIKLNLLILM